jgi:hypothetical protein
MSNWKWLDFKYVNIDAFYEIDILEGPHGDGYWMVVGYQNVDDDRHAILHIVKNFEDARNWMHDLIEHCVKPCSSAASPSET